MKERPIIFNDAMVRAILDGRKTQTRRAVHKNIIIRDDDPSHSLYRCPYGQPGDRLWVRECLHINDYRGLKVPKDEQEECEIFYRASGLPDLEGEESLIKWTPSIHMPRWASRITLEINAERVERLQDISEADALAEGVNGEKEAVEAGLDWYDKPRRAFRFLWQSIYGAESWQSNPWVWVVEFRRLP